MTMLNGRVRDPLAALEAESVEVPVEAGLPEIQVNNCQLSQVTDEALRAIAGANVPPTLFQRGHALARMRLAADTGVPAIEVMALDSLRGHLARAAGWFKVKRSGGRETRVGVPPPNDVARDLLSLPGWPEDSIPILEGIIECPTFAADGSLVDRPGYHPGARLWYHPAPGLVVPGVPRDPDWVRVRRARHWLLDDLLGDFPFADQASRANALALLLLPFVRPLIAGPTPLHLIEAAKAGTGKGLLLDVVHVLATGRAASATAESGKGEEYRKRILAALLDDPRFITIDNINGYLDSGALASALTTRSIKDRILGSSRMAEVPVRCVWIGTGNNVRMSTELARRTPLIRLVAETATPWTRPASDFRHPDLVDHATRNRGRLVAAALTLCRAWVAAGRPGGDLAVGSFGPWSRTMGGILQVIDVPSFMANAATMLGHANDDQAKWTALVGHWWARFRTGEVGAANLFPLVQAEGLLEGVLGDGNDESRRTRLGRALSRQRDSFFDDLQIVAARPARNGAALYRLRPRTGAEGRADIGVTAALPP